MLNKCEKYTMCSDLECSLPSELNKKNIKSGIKWLFEQAHVTACFLEHFIE